MTSGAVGIVDIFIVILFSSLFSLGGGNGPVAVIQDRWVSKGLLDPALFAWAIALGYLSPGPKAGFLSGIGYYMYGLPGALAAIVGIVIPTCVGAAGVSYGYRKLEPVIKWISLPAGFVIAGMITAAAWDMMSPMKLAGAEMAAVAIVAVLVAWRNLEPVIVVLGSAAIGLLWWSLT
jgi:chromate transporter